MYNNDFFQNINVENNITGDNDSINQSMSNTTMMNNSSTNNTMPINSGVQERVINRTFVHEVPQDFPFMIDK